MRNDLEMMLNPTRWPAVHFVENPRSADYAMLCLKKYGARFHPPATGLLFYNFSTGQWLFEPDDKTAPHESGGSELPPKLVQEGWLVD